MQHETAAGDELGCAARTLILWSKIEAAHIGVEEQATCSRQGSRRLRCLHTTLAHIDSSKHAVTQGAACPVPDTLNDSTKDGDIGTVTAWSARRTASSDAPAQEARCWSISWSMPAYSILVQSQHRLRGCQDSRIMQLLGRFLAQSLLNPFKSHQAPLRDDALT